jgi:hypothetical protein
VLVVLVAVVVVVVLLLTQNGGTGAPGGPIHAAPPVQPVNPGHPVNPDHPVNPPPAPTPVNPVGGPSGATWHLAFDENFSTDLNSLLTSGIWHAGWFGDGLLTDGVNSEEKALLTRDNLSVAGGVARLDVTPNVRHLALDNGTTEPNLGAGLNTDEAQASRGFMMTYGYAEARLQLPAAPPAEGVWPSFWLTGEKWPDDMEIDVVEGDGTDRGNAFNIHYGSNNNDTTNLNDVGRLRTVPGATTGWHTYGVEIRPNGVTFYYDGVAVYAFHGKVPPARRYLMVGVSSSAHVTGRKSLLVDYVRAWTPAGR